MQNAEAEDTIVALASGRGTAGIAVVRLSGSRAISITVEIFRPANAAVFSAAKLTYGTVESASGEAIDDCLVAIMPAPKSFTGEDVAEIQCHGGAAVIDRVIGRCLEAGARAAQPGEFSRRAFLNGKMDLAQAEALTDLIAARSESARRLSLRQLRGGLSKKLREINDMLLDAAAEIEAHIDFPEEDIPGLAHDRIVGRIVTALQGMNFLLAGHDKARIRNEGARVILAGDPNAGKSSLFNAILKRDRAIVSPHPGTTRDTIEAVVEINGLTITLVDTAGIRTGAGEIEQIGIDRTLEEIHGADLVLHLAEGQPDSPPSWKLLPGMQEEKMIRVWTKADQGISAESVAQPRHVCISTFTTAGIAELERLMVECLAGNDEDSSDAEMSRVRHAENLRRAKASAEVALQAFAAGDSGDLVMVDLRDALVSVGDILGERLDEQILDRVFSTFCLGK